jgi:hypothetical protein
MIKFTITNHQHNTYHVHLTQNKLKLKFSLDHKEDFVVDNFRKSDSKPCFSETIYYLDCLKGFKSKKKFTITQKLNLIVKHLDSIKTLSASSK